MGQQNPMYTGPMLDVEPQQLHPRPEPCMVFPPPYNNRTILPPPSNRTTFDPRYLPENHGRLPYAITQYNGEHSNTFMIPPPNAGVFPVPVNQGHHSHLPFSNNHQIFERNRSLFMDGSSGAFKIKNVEGYPGNFQCFYPSPGSSSSGAMPMTSEGSMMGATSFGATEHMRNRATGVMGFDFDPVVGPSNGHFVHGGQPVHAVRTPWLEQRNASGAFSWNRPHGVPYPQPQGYQVTAMNRNPTAFIHPPIAPHQGPHVYHPPPPPLAPPPMPPTQARNMDISQLASSSHRHSTSSTSANPFQNRPVDQWPRFVCPMPIARVTAVIDAEQRDLVFESTARHRSSPHLRVLPEEELVALGEQTGNVGSGLSDNFILEHLKTKTFAPSRASNPEDQAPADEEPNFCVICQMEFEDEEKIGALDCCHEYHVECIKKWLVVKNSCPICKSKGLN